jgi:hypothetical protein
MKKQSSTTAIVKRIGILLLMTGFNLLIHQSTMAQKKPEKPPVPIKITVNTLQHLEFGKIIPTGTFGTVTIPPTGVPSTSGDVYLISLTTPGLFDVESLPGTLINIGFPSSVGLTRSGSGALTLRNLTSDKAPSFITASDHTFVYIGGTLEVRSILTDNPAGVYGGTILVTFTQIHQ